SRYVSLPSFFPAIQSGDSKGVRRPGGFPEAGAAHPGQHFLRRREAFDGVWEIGVGAANTGKHSTDARQNLLEVEAVQMADDALGFTEVENAALAAGAQHAGDFAQSGIVVGEVAKAEG